MRTTSKKFNLRCTEYQFEQLSRKANHANLPLSHYLIQCGLSDNIPLSSHLLNNIEQIKFESALLQHHLDLLLNKKSYIEQFASLGELNNLISFLSFSAKSLHDIFLADFKQNKINQFNSNQNKINQFNYSICPNCFICSNCLLSINAQSNSEQLNLLSDNQLNNSPLHNEQLNNEQLNNNSLINEQLNLLHNNQLNDDSLNNNQIVASNPSGDALSNDHLSNNNSSISGISDNKAYKPTIRFSFNSNIAVAGLNNSFSTYSPISSNSYYFYLDENIPISFVFLSSNYLFFINQCSFAQSLDASHDESFVIDAPIIDGSVFETPAIDAPIIEVIENLPNLTFTDSSIIDSINNSINENLISEISINQNLISQSSVSQNLISQNSISQNSISQNSSATTLALSPISDIAAPTNIASSNQDKDLNQLNISSPIDVLCPINRPTITTTSSDNSNQLNIPSPTNVSVSNPLSISHLDNTPLHNSLLDHARLDNSCLEQSHLEQPVLEQPLLEQSPLDVSSLDNSLLDNSLLEQPHLDLQNDNTLNLSSLPYPNNPSFTNTPSITNSNLTDLNQLNCSSIDSIVPITHNLLHSPDCSSMSNIDNISSTSDCSSADHLHQELGIDPHSSLAIENHLDFHTESHTDPDLLPSQFYVIDDGSIDPNLIVSIPSHLLYPQDHSYSYDDYHDIQDLDDPANLEHFNQINTSSPFHQLDNNQVLERDLINQPYQPLQFGASNHVLQSDTNNHILHNNHPNHFLQANNHHSEVLKRDEHNKVLDTDTTNSNSNFSDLISSHSDNNCSNARHSNIADLNPSHSNNKDFP